MVEIDFYHIDAFEVCIFLPIYKALEDAGVRPRPIIPDDSISTSSPGYLDVKQCKNFYKKHKIKYYTEPNYDNAVCSTQGTEFLSLYSGPRIRIPYGPGVYPFGWGLTRKSTLGFDLILVHGEFYRKYLSYFISINKIFVSGYPRYDKYFSSKSSNKKNIDSSNFKINNKLNTILMLPTWGENSSLDQLLSLSKKLKDKFNILLKPHHLSVVRDSNKLDSFEGSGCIVLKRNDDLVNSISVSDIIICDIRSCVFSESILANKKTIGLALIGNDFQWVNQAKLNKISYIAYHIDQVEEYIKKYMKHDQFISSRSLWVSDKVEFSDRSSSTITAKILKEYVYNYHIPLFTKALRKSFALIFINKWINQRTSTKFVSLLHLLIIKVLGNYK